MYGTTIQLTMTPEQLGQLFDDRLTKALANYIPPAPIGAELPDLLTRKQAAAHLQVSLTTLHSWANDTDERNAILIPQHINGRVRYRRADVLATIKETRRFKSNGKGATAC